MAEATLLISSKNYSSWSLRVAADDPRAKEELLMRTSSILVPCLIHGNVTVWDTLAIAEYLNEIRPEAQMLPAEPVARARCRSISGEMHSGFAALRSSLPMNLRFHKPGFTVWSSAQADIDRITHIWRECLTGWKGPFLFGKKPTIADAMYAPVVTRFLSYDVAVGPVCQDYCDTIMRWAPMKEWVADSREEPQEIIELDLDF
jgi:glutathione S-transferase